MKKNGNIFAIAARNFHFSPRHRGGNEKSPRFYAIGDGFIDDAVQFLHAGDGDRIATRAPYGCAHRVEKILQVDDFRFPRRVMYDGRPVRKNGGEHDVFGRPYGGKIEIDIARPDRCGAAVDFSAHLVDFHAELFQPFQVHLYGAEPDIAAAGI